MRYSERHLKKHANHDDAALHHVVIHLDTLVADGVSLEQQHGHRSPHEIECIHLTAKEIKERERLGAEAFAAQVAADRQRTEQERLIRDRAADDPAFAALAGLLGLN